MNTTYLFGAVAAAALMAAAGGVAYVGAHQGTGAELGWSQYATSTFAVSYPPGFTPDPSYNDDIAPGRRSHGVKFTVSTDLVAGTNLSPDSYVSVEMLPTLVGCSATPYLYDPQTMPTFNEEGHTYSFAKEDGAAAGSMYEERVYARTGEGVCVAVRYFIHYNNLGDYEEGTVTAFNRDSVLSQFDRVRRSLAIIR